MTESSGLHDRVCKVVGDGGLGGILTNLPHETVLVRADVRTRAVLIVIKVEVDW